MNQIVYKNSAEYAAAKKTVKVRSEVTSKTREERNRRLLFSLAAAGLGILLGAGSFFLADVRSDWYEQLQKPFFCPSLLALYIAYLVPLGVFCAVYAVILIRFKGVIIKFEFLFNALLQILWTVFFFQVKAVFASMIILVLLVVHSFFLLKYSRKHVGNIAFLLLLHLARVVFGLLLNYAILILN